MEQGLLLPAIEPILWTTDPQEAFRLLIQTSATNVSRQGIRPQTETVYRAMFGKWLSFLEHRGRTLLDYGAADVGDYRATSALAPKPAGLGGNSHRSVAKTASLLARVERTLRQHELRESAPWGELANELMARGQAEARTLRLANPHQDPEEPLPETLPPDLFEMLEKRCEDDMPAAWRERRDLALVAVIQSGFALSEALSLGVSNVSIDGRHRTVSIHTPNDVGRSNLRKHRTVVVGQPWAEALIAWDSARRSAGSGAFFVATLGGETGTRSAQRRPRPLSYKAAYNAIGRMLAAAAKDARGQNTPLPDLKHRGARQIRASGAVASLRKGAQPAQVVEALGLQRPASVSPYLRAFAARQN